MGQDPALEVPEGDTAISLDDLRGHGLTLV